MTNDDNAWIDELVRLLTSFDQEDWKRARKLRRTHAPPKLFKYRGPNDLALKDLICSQVWAASPYTFNDPFDSSATVDAVQSVNASWKKSLEDGSVGVPEEMRQRLRSYDQADPLDAVDKLFADTLAAEHGAEMAAKLPKNFFRDFTAKQSAEMGSRLSEFIRRASKVCCFSVNGVSLMHWAHYAQNHEGFCLEFDTNEIIDDVRGLNLFPVKYSAERFSQNMIDAEKIREGKMNVYLGALAAMHKSPHWAHEEEWRIVIPDGRDIKGMHISMPKPAALYLGAHMQAEYRARVLDVAKHFKIPLFEMVLSPDKFALSASALLP